MAYDVRQWSTTDSSNNSAAPNGWATGTMIPSEVEPTGRMMMGGAARFYTDLFKPVTTGGTSTAYTVSITQQPSSIAQPLGFAVKWDQTCGATPTLNVNSKGAKSLYWPDGTQATTGDLPANTYSLIFYDGTNYVIYSLNKQAVSVSAASESTAGKAELATQAETNTGTDDARIVTPLKLTSWTPAVGTVTAATDDKVLLADTSGSGALKQALVSDIITAARPSVALYQNQQTSGTAGPNLSTGSWQTYPLTTEVYDAGGIGSLSSNQITLAAGTYEIFATASIQGVAGPAVSTWRARLYNATDTSAIVQGPQSGALGAAVAGVVNVYGFFTLAGSKAIELQVYMASGDAGAITAMTTGDVEVYASVHIRKFA